MSALLGCWLFLLCMPGAEGAEVLVATNATWRYAKGMKEASVPVAAWRQRGFNDTQWGEAPAPFYFGETLTGTALTDMQNRYTCVFLRRAFVVSNAAAVGDLTLSAACDDGYVAWINGVEVARYNVATNLTPVFTNVASGSAPEPIRFLPVSLPPPRNYLVEGTNVLAVQAFNRLAGNGDFQIDAELIAVLSDTVPPGIASVDPPRGAVVPGLSSIRVVFSEEVTNVNPDDLLVAGAPAEGMTGGGASYEFRFAQPPAGRVAIAWDGGQAITDLAGNRFDAEALGAVWEYTLNDTLPPVVESVAPLPGATVATLGQVEVWFNESVVGLDAGDLLVNGRGATNVSGSGRGPYVFRCAAPGPGVVRFAWVEGHGITDTAVARNPFGGGSWSCEVSPAVFWGDVVINEFLAVNEGGRWDEDGDASDWLEIHNRGSTSVNLAGWSLTDDPDELGLWVFPAVTLPAGGYLVVFASGKDLKPTDGRPLHTSFALAMDGEYLALANAESPRRVVTELRNGFPEQRAGISYGVTGEGTWAYSRTPSPGASNVFAPALSGVVAMPEAGVRSGFFDQPIVITLGCATPDADIWMTWDGSVPSPTNGSRYVNPVRVEGTANRAVVVLRAAGYQEGRLPSRTATYSYVFPDYVLRQPKGPAGFPGNWVTRNGATTIPGDYELDPRVITNVLYAAKARQALTEMPSLSLVLPADALFGRTNGLYANPGGMGLDWERACSAEFLFPDGSKGVKVDAGLRLQGGTSRVADKTYKHSLRLLFKGDHGPAKLEFPLFGQGGVSRFDTLVLDAGLNLVWHHRQDASQRLHAQYVRDQFMSDLQLAMGWPAPRGRFFHVYLNGLYWGIYDVHERPDASFAAAHFGGEKEEYDSLKNTTGFEVLDGTVTAWNELMALADARLADNAYYELIQTRVDVDNLIDYMLVNLWGGNTDWPHHNWYVARRQTGDTRFRFFSWDAEHVMKTVGENRSGVNTAGSPAQLYDQMRQHNAEFRLRFADRVHQWFFNGGPFEVDALLPDWDPAHPERNRPAARYLSRIAEIDHAIVLESARWGDTVANPERPGQPYERNVEWLNELNWVREDYLPQRSEIVLAQLKAVGLYPTIATAPTLSLAAGPWPAGTRLSLAAPAGSIYYTTDGSDPRVYGTGAVSASAREFAGMGITMTQSMRLRARTFHQSTWSAMTQGDYVVGGPVLPVRITEIQYQPVGGDPYEFVELQHVGGLPVSLGGFELEGTGYVFPAGTVLAAGQVIVLANGLSPSAFAARYPGVVVFGWFPGTLANGGETLTLRDAAGESVLSVTYDDSSLWPEAADGAGASLELMDVQGDPDAPTSWRASVVVGGTPGLVAAPGSLPAVRISEVLARNATIRVAGLPEGIFPDWIEVMNNGTGAVDLAGWSLSDGGDAREFVFPEGVMLAPGARVLVVCDGGGAGEGWHAGFELADDGESVGLFDAATNRVDGVTYGPQVADLSIIRTAGGWLAGQPTPGGANVPVGTASVTNLVLNEWLADAPTGGDDWIELFNRDATRSVALEGLYMANHGTVFRLAVPAFVGPRGHVRWWADEAPGADHVDLKLDASGDALRLLDGAGALVDGVTVSSGSLGRSEGRWPDGGAVMFLEGSGTPGMPNRAGTAAGVRLNEIMARNDSAVRGPLGQFSDWIELHNAGATSVDLTGSSLVVSGAGDTWRFPAGTVLEGGGFRVIWCDGDRAGSVVVEAAMNTGFGLDADGGVVQLRSAGGAILDSVRYGHQIANRSIGVVAGGWGLLAAPSPGEANGSLGILRAVDGVRFNEWMADNPREADWFELFNPHPVPVALGGLWLGNDPSLSGRTNMPVAPLSFVGPNQWVRFIADADPQAGPSHVDFRLSALGEVLTLFSSEVGIVDQVFFGPQNPGVSEGLMPDGGLGVERFAETSSPGAGNYLPSVVVINEILAHTDPPWEDAIELFNPGVVPVDIGGWFLSDDPEVLRKYRIPAGTVLGEGGYRVFYQGQFGGAGALVPFDLDSVHGDEVWLTEAVEDGTLTGRRAWLRFGASPNAVSIGRVVTAVGVDLAMLERPTFGVEAPGSVEAFREGGGAVNAPARVGPVVISEIHFRPLLTGTTNEAVGDEFVELRSLTASTVLLFDPMSPTNRWRLRGGVAMDVPAGLALPGWGHAVVVGFDPEDDAAVGESFRRRYRVPDMVPLIGPWKGRLANEGEVLRLERPDRPQIDGPEAGFVPYVVMETVAYGVDEPWPSDPAWAGMSLQRVAGVGYGNDPVSWRAGIPTPGWNPDVPEGRPFLSGPGRRADGRFGFWLHGTAGGRFVVEGSADLTRWEELAAILLETGLVEFLEPIETTGRMRFFRVRQLE